MASNREAGFAQILVLSALVVLSAILTASIATSRLGNRQASALDARVFADARLDAGLALLRDALADPDNRLEEQALAAPVAVEVADQVVDVAIASEGGKIDVLRADLGLVERFANNAGLSTDQVAELLEQLTARRDVEDDLGAFEAVELALAGAIGLAAVSDSFTRFGSDHIDPTSATDDVLRAIPDLTPSEVQRIIATPSTERSRFATASRYFASGSRRFTLIARFSDSSGGHFERRLPIELTTAGGVIELDRDR